MPNPVIGVPIPTVGRQAILDVVLAGLDAQKRVKCVPLILTHEKDVMDWAAQKGVAYLECDNLLGWRWNMGFRWFRERNVDYMMLLGSDDLLSDMWCITLIREMQERQIRAIGKEQYYFLDICPGGSKRMCRWNGYQNERAGETVGAGRLMSVYAMGEVGWESFDNNAISGLDESMTKKFEQCGVKIYSSKDETINGMGVTCFMWRSKRQHGLIENISEKIPWYNIDRFVHENFPNFYGLNLGKYYDGYALERQCG